MLNVQSHEYVRSLINTYRKQGYKYYLCCTNSDNNINTDIYLYLSKNEIIAISDTVFSIDNGIRVNIDTSSNTYSRDDMLSIENNIVGNMFTVDTYESIYTNCKYENNDVVLYPDIMLSSSDTYSGIIYMGVSSFMFVSIFLYLFIKNILRIRR